MTLPYVPRLICLLAVVVGLIHVAMQIVLAMNAPLILRLLRSATARQCERALYLIQVGPFTVALLFAVGICLPEYVLHEPASGSEDVSRICIFLSSAVLLWFGVSGFKGLRIAVRTVRFVRACRVAGQPSGLSHAGIPVISVPHRGHLIALVGFVNPVILVSRNLIGPDGLGEAAVQMALDHEGSHAVCKDNWKLLSLGFLPRLSCGVRGGTWFRHWQIAAECAADDEAVRDDPARRLLLAEALVRFARSAEPFDLPVIHTALSCWNEWLFTRVNRLIGSPVYPSASHRSVLPVWIGLTAGLLSAAIAIMPWIYRVSERILHLG